LEKLQGLSFCVSNADLLMSACAALLSPESDTVESFGATLCLLSYRY